MNIDFKVNTILILLIVMLGCDEVDLSDASRNYVPKLVIDGSIELDGFAHVALTKSEGYLENLTKDSLVRASEVNALVTLYDGENSEVLILRRNEKSFPLFVYRGSKIKGELGKQYELKVEVDGETYVSYTSIQPREEIDSLWFRKENDKFFLMGRVSDTPDRENYYRVFTKRIGIDNQFIPMYYSTISDQFFQGETIDFSIFKGVESFDETRDDGFFESGDSVIVKFSSLDYEHFTFWSTAESEIYSFSNPFSSSGNEVQHNVDSKALGVWGGYASNYYVIVAN
ncbi:DUF4249 family protein [Reichenbachiella versicolor]|uniref:DUF4249 family protein n=1 Tax=Reichenbachiella versicolor TaxID=1821036 RepID=UPI000D6E9332|nr:DUF4249 family protein [Reichenbachiella versicolor]